MKSWPCCPAPAATRGHATATSNGKGGFKLSLRGQDPAIDFVTLTRGMMARRLNPQQPEASLVLVKATAAVPHEGGLRFPSGATNTAFSATGSPPACPPTARPLPSLQKLIVDNPERFLVQPEVETSIKVQAVFSDGSTRDVTRLAVLRIDQHRISTFRKTASSAPHGPGETTILVRYLDQQTAVRLAFVPQRPGFVWSEAHRPTLSMSTSSPACKSCG